MGIIEKEGKKKRNLLPQTSEDLNKKISEKGNIVGFLNWTEKWKSHPNLGKCLYGKGEDITLHMVSNMKTLSTAEICCSAERNPSGESRGPWVSGLAGLRKFKDEET